jgi:hypothetical protein
LVGDKGYLSRQYQQDLFETAAIRLETPMRRNQIDFTPFSPVLRKARKRIETLFSQLCDQFMIRRNCAKSFAGFSTRILSESDRINPHPMAQPTKWKQYEQLENRYFLNAPRVNRYLYVFPYKKFILEYSHQ